MNCERLSIEKEGEKSMVSFFICLAILIGGYFIYGKIVEKNFGPDDRETPAVTLADGSDYVVMPVWRVFLIQLLNIAGLGPIFGALAGALWGPSVFLWITFGTIFAGGVHDYLSGMMSMRHGGKTIGELVGIYLGPVMKQVMRVFSVILLVLVGVAFSTGPAALLSMLTPTRLEQDVLAGCHPNLLLPGNIPSNRPDHWKNLPNFWP